MSADHDGDLKLLEELIRKLWLETKPSDEAQRIRGEVSVSIDDKRFPDWPLDLLPDHVWSLVDVAVQRALAARDTRRRPDMMSRPCPDRPDLEALIKKSAERFNALSPEAQAAELRAQRISWVYGNLALAGSAVTREQVARVVDQERGASDAAAERAQILAWLRTLDDEWISEEEYRGIRRAIDGIERGDHIQSGGKT